MFTYAPTIFWKPQNQKNSRRLWRSRTRKIQQRSPKAGADFPAAIFVAGKCPNLGRDNISCCRKNQGIIFQQRRNLPENLSSKEFRTATASSSFLTEGACIAHKTSRQFFDSLRQRMKNASESSEWGLRLLVPWKTVH